MDLLKKEICFLSKDKLYSLKQDSKKYTKEIILSPYYYWYFERKLPVNSIKRAHKIVPQMLESLLPNKELRYIIRQKDKKLFEIFVLDYTLFIEKLNNLGIDKKLVSNISFSHIEFEDIDIKLDSSILLCSENQAAEIDDKLNITTNLLKKTINEVLEDKSKLEFKYTLGSGNHVENLIEFFENNFYSIVFILVFILASLGVEIYSNKRLIDSYSSKKSDLISSQNYASHAVQLKYVMDNMLDLDLVQKGFRKNMKKIINLNGDTNKFIKSLEYDNKEWQVIIEATNKQYADSLINKVKFDFVRQNKKEFIYEKSGN